MMTLEALTPDQRRMWDDWVSKQSPNMRHMIEQFLPDGAYRLRDQKVWIYSYDENPDTGDVTFTVIVRFDENPHLWVRRALFPEIFTPEVNAFKVTGVSARDLQLWLGD